MKDTERVSVQVSHSDQPGQDPRFEPWGACPDWLSAAELARRQLGDDVQARAVTSTDRSVMSYVFSAGGRSIKLEGPPPGLPA